MNNLYIKTIDNLNIPGITYGFINRKIPGCSYKFIKIRENNLEICQDNLNIIADIIGHTNAFTEQVHSNNVIKVNSPTKSVNLSKADGLVTKNYGLNLWVLTADCVPVLLFDIKNQIIGSCHAGWKGSLSGVIENAINKMLENGANINSIEAIIGPCIRQETYEVGPEFYQQFIITENSYDKFFVLKGEKYLFDLPSFVKNKLYKNNINKLYDSMINTYTDSENWFSFRRRTHNPSEAYGSVVSFIRLEPK